MSWPQARAIVALKFSGESPIFFSETPKASVTSKLACLRTCSLPTLNAILKARFAYEIPANDLIQVRADFIKLSVATARRMFRFWLVLGVAKADS